MLNTTSLFASLVWGSVGLGYFIYGKKQQSVSAMGGGVLMIVISYFVGSALIIALASLGIAVAVYCLIKRGY